MVIHPGAGSSIQVVAACDIRIRPIDWLWLGWLALGKLHILAGPPGTGKTSVALSFAATLSKGAQVGNCWPDGAAARFGKTLVWSSEDDPEDTLVPRLAAAGANLSAVFFIKGAVENGQKRSFDFARDLPLLRAEIERLGDVRLVVIDPIMLVINGDAHKNREVRLSLDPLAKLAEGYGIAILGLTHVNKGSARRDPVDRVTGSLAFSAVARVVMLTAKMESSEAGAHGPAGAVLVRAKSNIGPTDSGFRYAIQQWNVVASDLRESHSSRVQWILPALSGTASQILQAAAGGAGTATSTKLDEAMAFLRQLLAWGPRSVPEIEADAKAAGISMATLRRARENLGLLSSKQSLPAGGNANFWSLPALSGDASPFSNLQQPAPFRPVTPAPAVAPYTSVWDKFASLENRAQQTAAFVADGHVEQVAQAEQAELASSVELCVQNSLRWTGPSIVETNQATIDQCLMECRHVYRDADRSTFRTEADLVRSTIEQVLSRNNNESEDEKQANTWLRQVLWKSASEWK
jgi:RecA-family ATPase